jgi:hypothetical protein
VPYSWNLLVGAVCPKNMRGLCIITSSRTHKYRLNLCMVTAACAVIALSEGWVFHLSVQLGGLIHRHPSVKDGMLFTELCYLSAILRKVMRMVSQDRVYLLWH